MDRDDSVTQWVDALKRNDTQGAEKLWEHYFQRLVSLARKQLGKVPPRGSYDENDVASSAFFDVCRAAQEGKFPALQDRDDLWRLMTTITLRKVRARLRRDGAQKRSAQRTVSEAQLSEGEALADIADRELAPDLQVLMADEYRALLDRLEGEDEDEELKRTAIWKLDGYTNEEIAQRLGCARRTVQRRLKRIRSVWQDDE